MVWTGAIKECNGENEVKKKKKKPAGYQWPPNQGIGGGTKILQILLKMGLWVFKRQKNSTRGWMEMTTILLTLWTAPWGAWCEGFLLEPFLSQELYELVQDRQEILPSKETYSRCATFLSTSKPVWEDLLINYSSLCKQRSVQFAPQDSVQAFLSK